MISINLGLLMILLAAAVVVIGIVLYVVKGSVTLVQHYPKEIPVILFSPSMRISDITDRHSARFSSRDKES